MTSFADHVGLCSSRYFKMGEEKQRENSYIEVILAASLVQSIFIFIAKRYNIESHWYHTSNIVTVSLLTKKLAD